MRDGQQKGGKVAQGVDVYGRRQVVIKMDTDQFDEVRARAVREGTSLAYQLRLLIEWGLMADRGEA